LGSYGFALFPWKSKITDRTRQIINKLFPERQSLFSLGGDPNGKRVGLFFAVAFRAIFTTSSGLDTSDQGFVLLHSVKGLESKESKTKQHQAGEVAQW
jgi:hypothetical protein